MESLVLNKDNVKLKVKASDWEEAVRIGFLATEAVRVYCESC